MVKKGTGSVSSGTHGFWIADLHGFGRGCAWIRQKQRYLRKHSPLRHRFSNITSNASSKTRLVITAAEDITPEWLTGILHRNGVAKGSEVSALGVLLSRELPISTVHRLSIEYTDNADEAERPPSLFLKLCGPGAGKEAAYIGSRELETIGRKEVEFYRTAAPAMGRPPLVRCYDAAFSEDSGRSHILLDDLTETHSQPAENTAPSDALSRQAVEALAKAHSHWWNSPKLGSGVGKVFDEEWLRKFVEDLGRDVREFADAAGLTAAQREAYRSMLEAAPRVWGRLTDPAGLTVTHGDMHWWNFLFPKEAGRHSVHVFDWHLWHIDLGARDLAFLLALGGFAEPRPEIESELLHTYHAALGIEGYSWATLNEDYRWSAIRNLNIPVIFRKQGKHYTTWQTALRRAIASFERLECAELI